MDSNKKHDCQYFLLNKFKSSIRLLLFPAIIIIAYADSDMIVEENFFTRNELIFIDNNNCINLVVYDHNSGHNNDNQTLLRTLYCPVLKIKSLDYSPENDAIVWCESNAIKYAELKSLQFFNNASASYGTILVNQTCGALAYESHTNILYYYSGVDNQIITKNLNHRDSSNEVVIIDELKNSVHELKVDHLNNYIFWTETADNSSSFQMYRANLNNGSQHKLIIVANDYIPESFELDITGKKVYIKLLNSEIIAITYSGYTKVLDIDSDKFTSITMDGPIAYCDDTLYIYSNQNRSLFGIRSVRNETKLEKLVDLSFEMISLKCSNTFIRNNNNTTEIHVYAETTSESNLQLRHYKSGITYVNQNQWHVINGSNETEPTIRLFYANKKEVTSIDYSLPKSIVVWCDSNIIMIAKSNQLNGVPEERNKIPIIKTIHERNSSVFAVDWVHDIVYYNPIDTTHIIAVSLMCPQKAITVVNTTKQVVNDIKVDPYAGYLFWTQWNKEGDRGELMRSSLDGTYFIHLLIEYERKSLEHFTIDRQTETLYLLNFEENFIEYFSYNGILKQKIYASKLNSYQLINSIEFYENSIYFINNADNNTTITSIDVNKLQLNITEVKKYRVMKALRSFKIIDGKNVLGENGNLCLDNACKQNCVQSNQYFNQCKCSTANGTDKYLLCERSALESVLVKKTEGKHLNLNHQTKSTEYSASDREYTTEDVKYNNRQSNSDQLSEDYMELRAFEFVDRFNAYLTLLLYLIVCTLIMIVLSIIIIIIVNKKRKPLRKQMIYSFNNKPIYTGKYQVLNSKGVYGLE